MTITLNFMRMRDPEVLKKVRKRLKGELSLYLSPDQLGDYDCDDDYDDEWEAELEWTAQRSDQFKTLNKQLESVATLLKVTSDPPAQFDLFVMLHTHVISSIDYYLFAVFSHAVANSEKFTRKLIETVPEFKDKKFSLHEIYSEYEKIKITVACYINELIFHDLKKIKPMYKDVLGIDFGDILWLFKAVRVRHDCVHRAGYDKKDNKVELSSDSITDLIKKCRELATRIDHHVKEEITKT
ncbi:MAG TPA: hypothetical protein DEB25_06700 [Desulfobulbaceae bacterium]|nr:hypothetical protein [Desulfobulbaceae bacterium]